MARRSATGEGVELLMAAEGGAPDLTGGNGAVSSRQGVVTAADAGSNGSMTKKTRAVGPSSGENGAEFTAQFIEAIARHRHWDREVQVPRVATRRG